MRTRSFSEITGKELLREQEPFQVDGDRKEVILVD
jgi:hypothetical protein